MEPLELEEKAGTEEIIENESLRVQKAEWVGRQIEKQRQQEDETRERLLKEQSLLEERRRSIEENLDRNRELKRYHEDCKEDLDAQIYALHGLTEDKLEGMKEYKNAYFRGIALAAFVLSGALVILSGCLYGFQSDLCLAMLAGTGVEGALLAQENGRAKVFDIICRLLYLCCFPVMLAVFLSYELEFTVYEELLGGYVIAGMAFLVIGTSAYFLYQPYRRLRRQVRAAKSDMREVEQIAKKAVKKNQKIRRKQEAKAARQKQREEARFERMKEREERKAERLRAREERKAERLKKREEMHTLREQKKDELAQVRKENKEEQKRLLKQKFSLFHKKAEKPEENGEKPADTEEKSVEEKDGAVQEVPEQEEAS